MEVKKVCKKCHQNLTETQVKPKINVPIVWVIGGPGSGKGTQCDYIVANYGFLHISTGDLLRRETQSRSLLSKSIIDTMQGGGLVSLDVVLRLLKTEIYNNLNSAKGFLIDGYPRAKDQGRIFEETIGSVDVILYFDAPEEVLINRVLNRGKTSGRTDDNEESLQTRMQNYYNCRDLILEEFREKIRRIDATKPPEDVFNNMHLPNQTGTSCHIYYVDNSLDLPIFSIKPKLLENMETAKSCKCHKTDKQSEAKPKINVPIIWVIGGPGCGKGTQCELIVKQYGFLHISTGDLLRGQVEAHSSLSGTIIQKMETGALVSLDIVLRLLKKEIYKNLDGAKGFLIDGYPRSKEQGTVFEQTIAPVDIILYFDAPEEILTSRVLHRAKSSGRVDDNETTMRTRLQTYLDCNDAILEEFQSKICKVDASGNPDDIFAVVRTYLDPLVNR